MSVAARKLVVVGSVALDTIDAPSGCYPDLLGGSASYFSLAAGLFAQPSVVAVVGHDFPEEHLALMSARGADLGGLARADGRTFRWHGRYSHDLRRRETLETQLNVFEQFRPSLPSHYRDANLLFLGNIDPELQLDVLGQVPEAELVAGDTMNLWIETRRDALLQVLRRLDLLILNDEEAFLLSQRENLVVAARTIAAMGPKAVLVKRGDAGALLVSGDEVFAVPAYPVERVVDPTGAGDAFAGGLMGYLARVGEISPTALRLAIAFGTAVASFTVEDLSVRRLQAVELVDVETRVAALRRMVQF